MLFSSLFFCLVCLFVVCFINIKMSNQTINEDVSFSVTFARPGKQGDRFGGDISR